MADPTDITQLDLQNLSPEEAAKLARARLAALYDQQTHAMLGMGGAMPELQKLGAAEYGQAGREREGVQQTAANVLKQTLGEKEATARIKEMELQGKQMMGMLNIAMGRQKLEEKHETFQQMVEGYKAQIAAQRPPSGEIEKDLVTSAARLNWAKQLGAPKSLVDLLEKDHRAKKQAVDELGYRTGGVPQWPGGEPTGPLPEANVSPAVPRAPGAGGGNVSIAPTPLADDIVRVQIPGHPPGAIHRSQLPAFKAKYPNALVAP